MGSGIICLCAHSYTLVIYYFFRYVALSHVQFVLIMYPPKLKKKMKICALAHCIFCHIIFMDCNIKMKFSFVVSIKEIRTTYKFVTGCIFSFTNKLNLFSVVNTGNCLSSNSQNEGCNTKYSTGINSKFGKVTSICKYSV